MSIARKNMKAVMVKWDVPGIIAGNQPPNYQDNQGSIARRLVIFDFIRKVSASDGDCKLGEKLQKEVPTILIKCNKAYLEAINKYKDVDIWKILPKYFQNTRKEMADQINSLVNFLNSDILVYNTQYYCLKSKFVQLFQEHCSSNNLKKPAFKKDFYDGPFDDKNLKVVRMRKMDKDDGKMKTKEWILGVDIRDDFNDEDNISAFSGTPKKNHNNTQTSASASKSELDRALDNCL